LFQFLKVGETLTIQSSRAMTGVNVSVTGLRLKDGELLIIASSCCCEKAIEAYAKRWEIETLFSCLKGRGLNLEDTHFTHFAYQTFISRFRYHFLLDTPHERMNGNTKT
jgi:hypothetical protein